MPQYLCLEFPDNEVTIDFLGGCTVTLKLEEGETKSLYIKVKGHDDRAMILMDESIELPPPDTYE